MFSRIRVIGCVRAMLMFLAVSGLLTRQLAAQSNPPFPMVAAGDSANLEHQDRKARLLRLSRLQDIVPPEFFEYIIPKSEHHLPGYGDLPVLRVVFNERVFFDFNRDVLRPEAGAVLETVAHSLQLEPPDVTVFIAGHTDAVGSVNYNLDLGLRRARAVAVALASLGVNQAQIFLVSFGKAVPIASNETEQGRARNRRVEFLFAARPEPIAVWLKKQQAITCAPNRSGRGNDCPKDTDLHFTAESVTLTEQRTDLALLNPGVTVVPAVTPTVVGVGSPKTDVMPKATPKEIIIGAKTIDIELKPKVLTVAPPR
ncbi:MAG TPA: OmpA family protein [Acidobacteriaceae bacterium]|nr:OmpA family protein [Acidobacteriaceae bacterium]